MAFILCQQQGGILFNKAVTKINSYHPPLTNCSSSLALRINTIGEKLAFGLPFTFPRLSFLHFFSNGIMIEYWVYSY
jgi:hypothetical protein